MIERVLLTEVVTRDGFQNEERFVSTEDKRAVIAALMDAGVRSIEVTAFVHPKLVPQLKDAEELLASIERRPDVTFCALIPNLKGAERALEVGVDEVRMVISASESHNLSNLNRSISESVAQLKSVCELVKSQAPHVRLAASIATSFACPFEGRVPIGELVRLIDSLVEIGVAAVVLADTTGMTNPKDIRETCRVVRERFAPVSLGLHLHNTRGMALANVLAGLDEGVAGFDSSLAGIGGCPFAPGATGNVATEDLVHMLHEMGIETGIDLDALLRVASTVPDLVGHKAQSHVLGAGKSSDLHPFDPERAARVS